MHVHILPFVHVANENFVDSSILELLLNETEDEKDIIHMINR